jgi:ABC-2 type transport system permease protein
MNTLTATQPLRTHLPKRWRPSIIHLGLLRGKLELIQFFRSKESVVFTIAFPVIMLGLFGAIVSYDEIDGVPFAQYFVPSMLAAGIFAAGFQSMAIHIAMEREKGVHRRLSTTPLPLLSYVIGKLCLATVLASATSGLLLLVAVLGYHVELPHSLSNWLLILGVSVLGLITCTVLGIAFSALPRTARAAPAIITPLALLVQIASGVFIPLTELPHWLHNLAMLSPLTWLVKGLQAGFLSTVHGPNLWLLVTVQVVWSTIGIALCHKAFQWRK